MVFDDGSHQEKDVIQSFDVFSPFIKKNNFFVVEDGFINNLIDPLTPNASTAVKILVANRKFKRNTCYDCLIHSSSHFGILERIDE